MWRALLLLLLATPAVAGVCTEREACMAACRDGDPGACVLGSELTFRPLTKEGARSAMTSRLGAHLWFGVGVKRDRAAAIFEWRADCGSAIGDWPCVYWAIAVQSQAAHRAKARHHLSNACSNSGVDVACHAAAKIWTRVTAEISGIKFSIELPDVMEEAASFPDEASWKTLWTSSTHPPDVRVYLDGKKLACEAKQGFVWNEAGEHAPIARGHNAKFRDILPASWQKRICSSIRRRR